MDNPLLAFAGLAAICGVCQWLAWRVNLPSILFLLTAGILVGPIFGLFDPDAFLGDLLFPFVSVAVAIILFEGGLTLRFSDIRDHGRVVTRLITGGVLLTWLLLGVAAHYIFDMPWSLAMVFGSIAVVSGPTVVKPLLRAVRPTSRVGHVLNWEGILIDPIGVFLALLVFDAVLQQAPGLGIGHIALVLAKLVIIGGAIGAAAGFSTAFLLKRYFVPDYLVNVVTLVIVVCIFSLAETLQHESGLLAVTIMGVWLANTKGLHVEEILHFKEDLSVLLISGLFVVLAARIDIGVIPQYGWQILAMLAVAQFVVRPLNAFLCTIGSDLTKSERGFIGWVAPRGIVAAAVSSVFALRLEEAGVPMAELLVPLVFSMIIGTVVFQSLTAKPLADWLGISNPEPNGVLFFGANEVGLALAKALHGEEIKVMLSDLSWRNVRNARRAGFEAYHGNPTSGHAAQNLDLAGIGKLVAVSSNRDANALAGMHFRSEFGSSSVFTLEGASEDEAYERFDTANRNRANPLFDGALNHARLARLLRSGVVRHLKLRDADDPEADEELEEEPDEKLDDGAPGHEGPDDDDPRDSVAGDRVADDSDPDALLGTSPEVLAMAGSTGPPDGTGAPDGAGQPDGGDSIAENTIENEPEKRVGEVDASEVFEGSVDAATFEAAGTPDAVGEDDLRMFAIDPDGKLYIYGAGEAFTPKSGWTVVVLGEQPGEADSRDSGTVSAAAA